MSYCWSKHQLMGDVRMRSDLAPSMVSILLFRNDWMRIPNIVEQVILSDYDYARRSTLRGRLLCMLFGDNNKTLLWLCTPPQKEIEHAVGVMVYRNVFEVRPVPELLGYPTTTEQASDPRVELRISDMTREHLRMAVEGPTPENRRKTFSVIPGKRDR